MGTVPTVTAVRSPIALVLCLLVASALLTAHVTNSLRQRERGLAHGLEAQTSSTLGRRANTWAARSSSGQTFGGTWTATEDPKTGAVTGSWTLVNAQGRTTASGGWSAAKSPAGWSGAWRAVATGRSGEYSGTWTASVDLKPAAKLTDLLAKAIEAAISGTWQVGGQSGAWTIQAFK